VKPIAKLTHYAVAGCKPEEMGVGPRYAIPKVLKLAGLNDKRYRIVRNQRSLCISGALL